VTGNKERLTKRDLIEIMQALGLAAEHKVEQTRVKIQLTIDELWSYLCLN